MKIITTEKGDGDSSAYSNYSHFMHHEKINAIFDQQASSYDERWSKLAPINHTLHLLTTVLLSELSPTAHILCVGAGTGAEILYLAQKHPQWRFTAVEPSTAMLAVLRKRAEELGISSRCIFHSGYLDSLPPEDRFDAATTFLVSQFILDRKTRTDFFLNISKRLHPKGILVSSDLAGDLSVDPDSGGLFALWYRLTADQPEISPEEGIAGLRDTYTNNVAVLPPTEVGDLIQAGGFDSPELFFQAGMIHAWYATRSAQLAAPASST